MSKRRTTVARRRKPLERKPGPIGHQVGSAPRPVSARPVKLHLGCGHRILDGYINIDLYSPSADMKLDITDLGHFADSSVDEIYLNAVFEHLYIFEQRKALAEWRRVLRSGGKLIINSIPDFDEVVRAYINRAPGNDGGTFDIEEVSRYTHGAYAAHDKLGQIHKDILTKNKMRKLLGRAGFEVTAIDNVCWQDEPNPVNMNVTAVRAAQDSVSVADPAEEDTSKLYAPLDTSDSPRFAAVYCVYDDDSWLPDSVESVYDACDAICVLVSDRPWMGEPSDNSRVLEAIRSLPDPAGKIRTLEGNWASEAEQRNAGLDILHEEGFAYCFVIDADEVYDQTDLKRMMRLVAKHPELDCWHAEMDTYWKSWRYRIEPREPLRPLVFVKVGTVRFTQNRSVEERRRGLIPAEAGICHHLSYARTDEQLLRKITTFSHAHEVRAGWYEDVWRSWDSDHLMRNLHPTHPAAYQSAIVQPHWALPPVLRRRCEDAAPVELVSIVVLTRNQLDYTRRCLESIDRCTSEPHEVIVVDNGSTDGTVEFLNNWSDEASARRLILNEENLGFAKGNNLGMAAASGNYVVLLNNDVVLTPNWLERMLACAARDPAAGIVGPVTNAVSGPQYVDQPLYETASLAGLDEFAEEWADKHARQTIRVHRAVGFCMLIRRSLIDWIGGLDERYGLGNFEDDDFCIRAALAGFKCMIARDCFVHHYGSATFVGEQLDYQSLMAKNWDIFKAKWGFPSNLRLGMGYDLSGLLKRGFDPQLHQVPLPRPAESTTRKSTAKSAKRRKKPDHKPLLSLCVIARDEEEFLPDCLASVKDVVDEIIVLDTGSQDGTAEIARSFGAVVHSFTWNDNYSDARNEALKHAHGEWILFLDSDERLDPESKAVLRQAVEKPTADAFELMFHNYCRTGSTTPEIVHRACRLHRNRPEYHYEGRVHESVVGSILASGGVVAELNVLVHHYGYQPEVKSRRNKHERYIKLLQAELKDKPGDPYVLHHLGAAYCAAEEYDKAIPHLAELAAVVPPDHAFAGHAFSRLANAYWATGKHDEALAVAERAAEKGITHPEIRFAAGNALLALHRYKESVRAFEEAVSIGRSGTWLGDTGTYGHKAEFGIGRAYMGLKNYQRAAEYGERVVASRPEHAHAHELLALAYTHLGHPQDAEGHWLAVLKRFPSHQAATLRLTEYYETQGRHSEAADLYLKLIAAGGESAETHHRLAACLETIGDSAAAEQHYQQAVGLKPELVEALNDLGRLCASQGRVQQALDSFARAVEMRPDYANAYFNAGDVLYSIGRYLEAAEVYENGLAKDSTRAEGFFALGNCCFKLGACDAAATAYQQALNVNPDYPDAESNLSLALQAMDSDKAA